ncbi:MAG TPA: hypothetical protein DD706_13105 [Nitrospiraceae bacterium]|nr:hypothetical protein [Nitrospiraceae bacterium]
MQCKIQGLTVIDITIETGDTLRKGEIWDRLRFREKALIVKRPLKNKRNVSDQRAKTRIKI